MTVLKQDALLLYNPKECRGEKKFVLSSSLRIPDPSLHGDPWTSYQPAQELTLSMEAILGGAKVPKIRIQCHPHNDSCLPQHV